MKKIYIDSDFKCHIVNDGTMRVIDTDFFDGKCGAYIEGYRFVPNGETWTREDGRKFRGEMIAPWSNYDKLDGAQSQYELMMDEAEKAFREGVNSID